MAKLMRSLVIVAALLLPSPSLASEWIYAPAEGERLAEVSISDGRARFGFRCASPIAHGFLVLPERYADLPDDQSRGIRLKGEIQVDENDPWLLMSALDEADLRGEIIFGTVGAMVRQVERARAFINVRLPTPLGDEDLLFDPDGATFAIMAFKAACPSIGVHED